MSGAAAAASSGGGGDSGGGGGDPWAWLGLLKWSLSYTDGTSSSDEPPAPMSPEDKEFLEKVMKEGIIDENDRMKTILKEVTDIMTKWKEEKEEGTSSNMNTGSDEDRDNKVDELLEELRDIVEQIDYARAFVSMKGLDFILGSVQSANSIIPASTRGLLLGILATLASNNPPVQDALLQAGAIGILTDVYFQNDDTTADHKNDKSKKSKLQLQARCMQALSASVRSHATAEQVFCQIGEKSVALLMSGLSNSNSTTVQKRTLFFLSALLTSDTSTRQRVQQFQSCIVYVIDHYLLLPINDNDDNDDLASACSRDTLELREMALTMIERILEQGKSVDAILTRKDALAGAGVRRVSALRKQKAEAEKKAEADEEFEHSAELEHWERILVLLARAVPDAVSPEQAGGAPLKLEADKMVPGQ